MPATPVAGVCSLCRGYFSNLLRHTDAAKHAEQFWTDELLAGIGLVACPHCGSAVANERGLRFHLRKHCKAVRSASRDFSPSGESSSTAWTRRARESLSISPVAEKPVITALGSSTSVLAFQRTDGELRKHPAKTHDVGFMERIPQSHEVYRKYTRAIGERMAQLLERSKASSYAAELPDNYAIYAHRRPGGHRTRYYLYGSKHRVRFTFPGEFIPHVDWLIDETHSLDNHSTCKCRIGPGSRKTKDSGLLKRAASSHMSSFPQMQPVAERSKFFRDADDMDPQRSTDLKHQDDLPIRKGELAWLKVSAEPFHGSDLPAVTHWPVMVVGINYSTRLSGSDGDKVRIQQDHVYSLFPLGDFEAKERVHGRLLDILPWKAGEQLMRGSGEAGWARFMPMGEDIMQSVAATAGACPGGRQAIQNKWHELWGYRPHLATVLASDWRLMVARLGIAIRQAKALSDCYCLTDKVEPTEEWLDDPETCRKTEYQGLYWAGERIWVDDIVRLKPKRVDPGGGSVPAATPSGQAMFLRIFAILVELIDTPSESNDLIWGIKLVGELLELQPAAQADEEQPPSYGPLAGLHEASACPKLWPPEGFAYRRLNPPGTDAILDLSDIAGRLYPTLIDSPLCKPPAEPSPAILSLAGLAPGAENCQTPHFFEKNLAEIFQSRMDRIQQYYIDSFRRVVDPAHAKTFVQSTCDYLSPRGLRTPGR